MDYYQLKNGKRITQFDLDRYEELGLSELHIAQKYGISRMHLFNIRKEMGWDQLYRSDKGLKRRKK
jgi:hypothetical protein